MGSRSDHSPAAPTAGEQPREDVLGGIAGTLGGVLPAFVQDGLASLERGVIDQRAVEALMLAPSEDDPPHVHRVAEQLQHGPGAPQSLSPRPVSASVQPVGQALRPQPRVPGLFEDRLNDGGLTRVRLQNAELGVHAVAERGRTPVPAAARGLALHACHDTVDEGGALELGENAEHLDHHPASGRAGLEGLGRAPEDHAGVIEVFEEISQPAYRSREPVDSIPAADRSGASERRTGPGTSFRSPPLPAQAECAWSRDK